VVVVEVVEVEVEVAVFAPQRLGKPHFLYSRFRFRFRT
jgi:hypothetical protein